MAEVANLGSLPNIAGESVKGKDHSGVLESSLGVHSVEALESEDVSKGAFEFLREMNEGEPPKELGNEVTWITPEVVEKEEMIGQMLQELEAKPEAKEARKSDLPKAPSSQPQGAR